MFLKNNFFNNILEDIFSYKFYYKNLITLPNNYSTYNNLFQYQDNITNQEINHYMFKEIGTSYLSLLITEDLFHQELSLAEMNIKKAYLISNNHLSKIAKTNNIHMKNDKENANLIKIIFGMIYTDILLQQEIKSH